MTASKDYAKYKIGHTFCELHAYASTHCYMLSVTLPPTLTMHSWYALLTTLAKVGMEKGSCECWKGKGKL